MANICVVLTRSFFLPEDCFDSFAGGLVVGDVCLRFFAFFELVEDFSLSPCWRKLSFRGVPVLAMAARERIISVWAAILILFSLPASLAGLQVGISGVLGKMICLGVPSPSLPFLCLEGVLGKSTCSSRLRSVPGVRGTVRSEPLTSGLFTSLGELSPWMSCSISVACLARELVFEGAFPGLDWEVDTGRVTAAGLKSPGAEEEGVDCCCSCTLPLISFSLLAVTFGISWGGFFSVFVFSRDLVGPLSAASFLLLSSLSFLLPELWESWACASSLPLSSMCFLPVDLDLFPDFKFFKDSGCGASTWLVLAVEDSWLRMLRSCLREFLFPFFCCSCGGIDFSVCFNNLTPDWGSAEHLIVWTLRLGLLALRITGFVRGAVCKSSFSVCMTQLDDDVFIAVGMVILVLEVGGWTSAEDSKHKILLWGGMRSFGTFCWLVLPAGKGWTTFPTKVCAVPLIQRNKFGKVRQ